MEKEQLLWWQFEEANGNPPFSMKPKRMGYPVLWRGSG
jgi:hypothetical protein